MRGRFGFVRIRGRSRAHASCKDPGPQTGGIGEFLLGEQVEFDESARGTGERRQLCPLVELHQVVGMKADSAQWSTFTRNLSANPLVRQTFGALFHGTTVAFGV